jgi:hypothetical protein
MSEHQGVFHRGWRRFLRMTLKFFDRWNRTEPVRHLTIDDVAYVRGKEVELDQRVRRLEQRLRTLVFRRQRRV